MYRILIVDDEEMERNGLCSLINKFQLPLFVFTQNNGQTALDFLRKNPVDIVCTDIKMPFMDGLELCSEIRKLYPDIYLILLSAYGQFDYAKQAIHIKIDEYLLKPISPKELFEALHALVVRLEARDREQPKPGAKNQLLDMPDIHLATTNKLVLDAVDIISREYTSNLSLESIAAQLNITKNYLCHIFKEETDGTVMQYITQLRMSHAKNLLLNTSLKINEISEAVGYQDSSYFAMQFKKLYNITPLQFRNGEMK